MAQGEKVFISVQAQGLANARKELQKNLWSFQTHRCLKSILVSGGFCLTCTRDKSPDSSERREYAQGPWQGGSCLPWWGGKQGKELPQHPVLPTPPIPSGWQATQWPAAAFTLAGDGCGEGNFSAEVELLRADCRYTVLWKSLLLKKTTKENRRN